MARGPTFPRRLRQVAGPGQRPHGMSDRCLPTGFGTERTTWRARDAVAQVVSTAWARRPVASQRQTALGRCAWEKGPCADRTARRRVGNASALSPCPACARHARYGAFASLWWRPRGARQPRGPRSEETPARLFTRAGPSPGRASSVASHTATGRRRRLPQMRQMALLGRGPRPRALESFQPGGSRSQKRGAGPKASQV
jgi:hypothetical protein